MHCPKSPAASPPKPPPTSPLTRVALNEGWVLSLPYYQCLWIYLRSNTTKTYYMSPTLKCAFSYLLSVGAHLRASSSKQPYGYEYGYSSGS